MSTLWIWVVDSAYQPIKDASVKAAPGLSPGQRRDSRQPGSDRELQVGSEEEHWVVEAEPGSTVLLTIEASGHEPEVHSVRARDEITQVVVGLRQGEELSYTYGDNRLAFKPRDDVFLMSVLGDNAADTAERVLKKARIKHRPVSTEAADTPDSVFLRLEATADQAARLADELTGSKTRAEILRTIEHGERAPLGLPNELVVRFTHDLQRRAVEELAAKVGMSVEREVRHAGNGFLLVGKGGPSYDVLAAADVLAADAGVEYVEPNLRYHLEADAYTPNDPLYAQVPHLPLIGADDAWDLLDNVSVNLRGGSPSITVAVMDVHGVAPNHPDLTANLTDGTSKLVASMNFASAPIATQTVAGLGGDHGTQCAASATAAFDDTRGIPGVAPNCHLLGGRNPSTTNAVAMADSYLWLAGFMNGSTAAGFPATLPARAADVISSSYGNTGLALSNTMRDLFDFLTTYGRNGKGCVVLWSLGNSGYGDFTSPVGGRFRCWPTYARCLAIGSSINTGPTNPIPVSFHADQNGNTNGLTAAVDRRALYSPFGPTALRKPDLVSPSHTAYNGAGNSIDPILSAERVGLGAINGCILGVVCNDYDTTFGGTSHSTPTVAGGVALLLSGRPTLNWVQVRDILRQSCVRIDSGQANATGQWQDLDGDGVIDYSQWYGAGRLDLEAATNLVLDGSLPLSDVYVRENLADTGTVPSGGSWWASPDVWVRQDSATPIPTLAWSDPAPHQNALRGQDNALFCRVRNRGNGPASTVNVRAMITHWAGLEFIYPADFQPSNNVGAPIPNPLVPGTYLIGDQAVNNLAPGADQIIKFTWPQALIPPATVMVGMATVTWHPCLLVEASPHDGPPSVGGVSAPVQGNNNIAQRNITIATPDSGADSFVGMIAGTRLRAGIATLVLDPTMLSGAKSIRIHVADEAVMKRFIAGALRRQRQSARPDLRRAPSVLLDERARLRVGDGRHATIIEAAAGSRITTNVGELGRFRADVIKHHDLDAVEISDLQEEIEIPFRLDGGQFVPVLVAIIGEPKGDLRITQRRADGELSGGYGIRTGDG